MKRFLFLLPLLLLPACDSADDEVRGLVYTLRLEGTTGITATCTINLETSNGVDSATFQRRPIPDEALLGRVLSASAVCTKDQELGRLRIELSANGTLVDSDETEEPFGATLVAHP